MPAPPFFETQAYFFAIGSTICFAAASLMFAEVARKISPLWMNAFKAGMAWVCFAAVVVIGGSWVALPPAVLWALLGSGFLGLGVGDVFLLNAYARMGAARTLVLYGFQPLFLGVAANILFGQKVTPVAAVAVMCFIGCLFIFSLEKFKASGHWEIIGLAAALLGVMLDNCGVILSRWSFDQLPGMDAFQANLVRCSGALVVFFLFGAVRRVQLLPGWKRLGGRGRAIAALAAFLGTFMSLYLYLTAVKIGNLASISAIGVVGPILASAMECLYYRKWPSRYLIAALAFFLAGFGILVG